MQDVASDILLNQLNESLEGTLHYDALLQTLYATDASVYREMPLAVTYPKTTQDIQKLIEFAKAHSTSLIPRTAGTSLAGQCVGKGIVVDVSKHFTKIIELNVEEQWVRVQPGVIRNELNAYLKPFGLFFSPITATATRAMIGGMVGNNSCGTTSIEYGSTREHCLELKCLLSDGSEAEFGEMSVSDFEGKCAQKDMEGSIYRHIYNELSDEAAQAAIHKEFPKASIHRRNTGYAVDFLLKSSVFSKAQNASISSSTTEHHAAAQPFNFCKLLCGSEGTLAFMTEIKLHLNKLPLPHEVVVAAHFESIQESMLATQIAMRHRPSACELMDKIILDCTKDNIEQRKNRDFVEGDPQAVLMVEFRAGTATDAEAKANALISDLQTQNVGYAYPIIHAPKTKGVWALRSAGLGLLANIPGDKKAVACIEDTAVALEDLADYIADFTEMMREFGQKAVYYAHAGAGELHLRPILDLKKKGDVEDFYRISEASAKLVKKYGGSLSGEHGDGRVRAAFIPMMVGAKNYALFQRIKKTWDPEGIFNPGKIVDAAPMNEALRYEPDQSVPDIETVMDFSETGGILRLAEKCNGSGDCRKLPLSGGTMCPSYHATRNEKDTTRARANTLREFLTKNTKENPFDHAEIKAVMDLCISCKGCTSECPSNVDMSSMKAEFLHQYQKTHGVPLRSRAFAHIADLNRFGAFFPAFSNFFLKNRLTSSVLKHVLGVAPKRSLPLLQKQTLRAWYKNWKRRRSTTKQESGATSSVVYLFCDEFTNYNDTHIGIKTIELLTRLGYDVRMVEHPESGRAALSKGLLEKAQSCAQQNVDIFSKIISEEVPLLGIEPSAILSFKDEYPRLVASNDVAKAKKLAENCMMVETFIAEAFKGGTIDTALFPKEKKHILLHGHCHQKALANVEDSAWMLSIPSNFSVEIIPSGCCGMAGSFGYEKEHYQVSMAIGELVLFPAVRAADVETVVVAPGTSCRHQIGDGTGRSVLHPVEVLWEASM